MQEPHGGEKVLPKLLINGVDFTGLLAKNGLIQRDVFRQSRSIITLDGVEHRAQIQKRQLDVSFVRTRLERLMDLTAALTQPSEVTYIDRKLGEVTRSFWVEGLSSQDRVVEAGVDYVDGISFTLVER